MIEEVLEPEHKASSRKKKPQNAKEKILLDVESYLLKFCRLLERKW